MLRRFYKGLDPNELTMEQYNGLLNRMADIIDLENGPPDQRSDPEGNTAYHRRQVERRAARREQGGG